MSQLLRLNKLKFVAGPSASAPPLEIRPSTVLVFVGPNNSGKSFALREIEEWCQGHNKARKVIDEIDVEFPKDQEEATALIEEFRIPAPEGAAETPDNIWLGHYTFRDTRPMEKYEVSLSGLRYAVQNKFNDHFRGYLLKLYTVRLDGRTRFALSDPKPTGDLQSHPQNHLWALFQDDAARERVRRLTQEAFGLSFVIDPTAMTEFRIRMSRRPPETKQEEQSLDAAARQFHGDAQLISNLSDGVQAFVGLVSALMSLPHRILLIDEPEAFLHPPLARRLGANLATLASERSASLLVSTHSADFLMGCVASTRDTTIVRLTYEDGRAAARVLSASDLQDIMHDPLLRSTNALDGLFHRAVVVTESDSDRAFYDEINRRLQEEHRGIEDVLFTNVHNWQTIPRLVRPLRRLGIPAAAVMDLDALLTDSNWNDIYEFMGINVEERCSFEHRRQHCASYLKKLPETADNQKMYKVQGIRALNESKRFEVRAFIQDLADYGLFIVDVGELERWLPSLGIRAKKSAWLVKVFSAIGGDPSASNYLRPGTDDVWEFLDQIAAWIKNPDRKGLL